MLADADATCLLAEEELTAEVLWDNLSTLLYSPEERASMEENIRQFADRNANERIFEEIMSLVK